MNDVQMNIPDGFQVLCREEIVDILTAGSWLRTKKQRRYTSAHRIGDMARLSRHIIKCPFCGYELPAYNHYLGRKPADERIRISRNVIDEWASPQYSLFDMYDTGIALNQVVIPEEKFICTKCGGISPPYKGMKSVRICRNGKKISITCSSAHIKNVLGLMMKYARRSVRLVFPLFETVEFNLGRGRVYLKLLGADGTTLAICDLTYSKSSWKETEVYSLIRGNYLVCRKLTKAFETVYSSKLPFLADELSPETFVAMTQFIGYPREFYDAVPYDLESGCVGKSFRTISAKLHNSGKLVKLYCNSALPQMKSIRRLFFSCPGYFFYLREVETLWSILRDPNYLCRVLSMSRIYELLSFLHQYPGAFILIRDYKSEKGMACLLNKLENNLEATQEYAIKYCSMNNTMRKKERNLWNKDRVSLRLIPHHSIPMQTGIHRIKDCCVDGYSFCWLKTKHDYIRAGKALKNCLGGWQGNYNPVVVVKKGDQFKAAIEIRNDMVVQARARNNNPIENDEKLHKAVEKWKALNNLQPIRFIITDDDDDELWF